VLRRTMNRTLLLFSKPEKSTLPHAPPRRRHEESANWSPTFPHAYPLATHVVRLPRFTLKAGSKAGSPADCRLEMWAYVVVALWQILLRGLRALAM
jgi:hypothetical protein